MAVPIPRLVVGVATVLVGSARVGKGHPSGEHQGKCCEHRFHLFLHSRHGPRDSGPTVVLPRLGNTAAPDITPGLFFVRLSREPLQVVRGISAASAEGNFVIDVIAGAGESVLPGGWAGLLLNELAQDLLAALLCGVDTDGYCAYSYEYDSKSHCWCSGGSPG